MEELARSPKSSTGWGSLWLESCFPTAVLRPDFFNILVYCSSLERYRFIRNLRQNMGMGQAHCISGQDLPFEASLPWPLGPAWLQYIQHIAQPSPFLEAVVCLPAA